MPQPLLTPRDVAERLQLSPRTVLEWLRWGDLPGMKVGHSGRVQEEDLTAFLQRQRQIQDDRLEERFA